MTCSTEPLDRTPTTTPARLALIQQNVSMPFLFEAAETLGVEITLIHTPDVTPPLGLPAVCHTLSLDLHAHPQRAQQAIAEIHREKPFDGTMAGHESTVTFTAELAAALNLPGISVEAAHAARDKRVMRGLWAAAGLNVPGFVTLAADQPPPQALETLRFPVVVKPANGFSSQGVVRVEDRAGIDEAVRLVHAVNRESLARLRPRGDALHGVIVEEFIDGPEYAVEAFAHRGEVHVLSIGYKGNARGPYFEESVYIAPAELDGDVRGAIVSEVRRGVAALGLREGPAHVELRLMDASTPILLEVGARIGGSGVSHFIVQESTGVDFAGLTIECALGRDITVPDATPVAVAANYIVPLEGHGVFREVTGLDDIAGMADCRRILRLLPNGCVVAAVPRFTGYPAFVLSRHDSYAQGEAFHRLLSDRLAVSWS